MSTVKKCRNSEPGTFNHECGKPAGITVRYRVRAEDISLNGECLGIKPGDEFTAHYCPKCWHNGTEAQRTKRLAVAVDGVTA
jgi:hypothetical protein